MAAPMRLRATDHWLSLPDPEKLSPLVRQVADLERRLDAAEHLAGTVLATLELNRPHFFRGDAPAAAVFADLLAGWLRDWHALKRGD